jgi:DNA-directed RNA polymerase specialized sigma24 family protein
VFQTLHELAALSELTADQREVLVDRAYGHRHRDIAARMGISEGNSRILDYRASRSYRQALQQPPGIAAIMAEPCGGALAKAL